MLQSHADRGPCPSRRASANRVDHHHDRAARSQQPVDLFRGSRLFDAKAGQFCPHGSNEIFRICHGLILPAMTGNGAVTKLTLLLLLLPQAAYSCSDSRILRPKPTLQQVMDIVRPKATSASIHRFSPSISEAFAPARAKAAQAICERLSSSMAMSAPPPIILFEQRACGVVGDEILPELVDVAGARYLVRMQRRPL